MRTEQLCRLQLAFPVLPSAKHGEFTSNLVRTLM
jgi:hypothetical protein